MRNAPLLFLSQVLSLSLVLLLCPMTLRAQQSNLPALTEIQITSTLDGTEQPSFFWAPDSALRESEELKPAPLFVFLHSWSGDYRQNNSKWQREAVKRGWIYLHPNFRGANRSAQACGSKFARQDILDAMDWAQNQFAVKADQVYLCGVSGGGHMAMLMAGHHPERFTAVSAWVGISDVAEWYRFHLKDGKPQKYAQMILRCFGAAPGSSDEIDADYRDRSPLFHIHRAKDLQIDIFAGVNDGHSGSVPVSHSLRAYNAIARTHGNAEVSESELNQLWSQRKLEHPGETDMTVDATLGREIHLRRSSKKARVTIFEGGHESIPEAAIEGLINRR